MIQKEIYKKELFLPFLKEHVSYHHQMVSIPKEKESLYNKQTRRY